MFYSIRCAVCHKMMELAHQEIRRNELPLTFLVAEEVVRYAADGHVKKKAGRGKLFKKIISCLNSFSSISFKMEIKLFHFIRRNYNFHSISCILLFQENKDYERFSWNRGSEIGLRRHEDMEAYNSSFYAIACLQESGPEENVHKLCYGLIYLIDYFLNFQFKKANKVKWKRKRRIWILMKSSVV